jgi:hypothetical protein
MGKFAKLGRKEGKWGNRRSLRAQRERKKELGGAEAEGEVEQKAAKIAKGTPKARSSVLRVSLLCTATRQVLAFRAKF